MCLYVYMYRGVHCCWCRCLYMSSPHVCAFVYVCGCVFFCACLCVHISCVCSVVCVYVSKVCACCLVMTGRRGSLVVGRSSCVCTLRCSTTSYVCVKKILSIICCLIGPSSAILPVVESIDMTFVVSVLLRASYVLLLV